MAVSFVSGPPRTQDLLPEILAGRCVHSLLATATCRACLVACPRDAWVLDEERLGIDPGRCDGCGLCAPACPQGAVLDRWRPLRVRVDGYEVAHAACFPSGTGGEWGLLPCLHVLGSRRLLELYRDGVRRLVLARGDCDTCPRGGVPRIGEAIDEVNLLLRDRDLPPLPADELAPATWSRALADARALSPALGRRAFLRRALTAAVEQAADLAERETGGTLPFVPPGRLLPRTREGLSLLAPLVDSARCDGCDACARVCPHDAIRLGSEGYHLDADGCTGCGLCVAVCGPGAVRVERLVTEAPTLVPLDEHRCRACGARFHLPATRKASERCPTCAVARHRRRLFQVFEPEQAGHPGPA